MTTEEITKLIPGSKVYLIRNGEIQSWETIGFNPKYPKYFYLSGNGSVTNTKCLYLEGSDANLHWETDYNIAKEVMWGQLKERVNSINHIYMDGKGDLDFRN